MGDFYHGRFKLFLALPLVLFVVFLGIVGYWPGITQGVDLKGGSLLFIDAPKPVSEIEVLDFLNENFDLVDTAVSSISSPLGNKVRIQFVESESIALLKADMDKSTELLKASPLESKAFSLKVLGKAKAFVSSSYSLNDNPERLHSLAFGSFLKARQAFNEGIKEKLVERFKLGSNVGMQSEDINPVLGQMFWQGALWVGLF